MAVAEDKPGAILKATLEMVAEHGFHGAPTSMIAEKAGVGVGTIYRYFKDKDELIHAVHEQLEARIESMFRSGYSEERPFRERFFCLWGNLFRYLLEHPTEFKFLEQYFDSPFGVVKRKQKLESSIGVFEKLYEDGKKQQVIKDLPLVVLCDFTFGPITQLVKDHIFGFLELTPDLIDGVIEAAWDGVKR